MAEKTRRPSGTGSIYQRADGMWCQVIELPNYGGKRRRKVIARKNRADLAGAVNKTRRDLAVNGDIPSGSPTLASWMDTWLEKAARDSLKPRTADGYRRYADRYIVPTLGKTRIDRLTAGHVDRLHDAMMRPEPDGMGLSSTTALQAHRILARALAEAKRRGLVTENVATLTDAPSKAYAPRPALTVDQARALLLDAAQGDKALAAGWSVALLAGLRQGERLGLTRDAIDLDARIITVQWQVQRLAWRHGCGARKDGAWPCGRKRGGNCPDRNLNIPSDQEAKRVHGGLWMTRPKSRAGWREVPVCEPLRAVLAAHLAATAPGDEGLVFHDQGHPIDPSSDSQAWHDALEHAELPPVPLHSARHTTNTLLAWLGVPVEVREKIMGHSSAAVNLNYTHAATADAVLAMRRLGELISGSDSGRLASA